MIRGYTKSACCSFLCRPWDANGCEVGCKCTIKADDATQCSCGKAVVTIKCPAACKVEAPKVETK